MSMVTEARPPPEVPDSVFEQLSMKGKVVCISGGGAGIGYSVAEGMAEAGADVALWYNSNEKTHAKADDLAKKYGVKAKAYKCVVTDNSAVEKTVAQVVEDFGRLDCFVANAGTSISGGILERTTEDWHKIVDVNYHGVYYCARAAGFVFKKQGFGNLIITASMSGQIVNVPMDQGCYNSTKAAVAHLGKSLAREWRHFARVNIVSPGFFETDMGASSEVAAEANRMAVLGRQGQVKEIKALYLYLASNASTFVTGSEILIDGGYTLP